MSKFNEIMESSVKSLVENVDYAKSTAHATFSPTSIEMPEGVSLETIESHIRFFNDVTGAVEVATAQVARNEFESNKELTTIDGTLTLGDLVINSQHHLQMKVGDTHVYGASTTAVDYIHSEEQSDWLIKAREVNHQEASKLFDI